MEALPVSPPVAECSADAPLAVDSAAAVRAGSARADFPDVYLAAPPVAGSAVPQAARAGC